MQVNLVITSIKWLNWPSATTPTRVLLPCRHNWEVVLYLKLFGVLLFWLLWLTKLRFHYHIDQYFECLCYIDPFEGTSFNILHIIFLCKGLSLFLAYSPSIFMFPTAFIQFCTHQNHGFFRCWPFFQISFEPVLHRIEGMLWCEVKCKNDTMTVSKVHRGKSSKSFLSSCIPNHKLYTLSAFHIKYLGCKLYAYRCLVIIIIFIMY